MARPCCRLNYLHEPTGLDGNWDIVSAAASPVNGEAGGSGGGGRRLPFSCVPAELGLFAGRLQDLKGRQRGERVQRGVEDLKSEGQEPACLPRLLGYALQYLSDTSTLINGA